MTITVGEIHEIPVTTGRSYGYYSYKGNHNVAIAKDLWCIDQGFDSEIRTVDEYI